MLLLALTLACATAPEDAVATQAEAPSTVDAQAHGAPGEQDAMHGRSHEGGDHATVDHSFEDVDRWTQVFDDPDRKDWQKPAELVGSLDLEPGMVVADIGAGTGYFNRYLADVVGQGGKVIAVDIEQSLVDHMAERAGREETPQVEARLGTPDDPGLKPGEVDFVMMVDTYHHVDDRVAYFTALRDAVKPGGRLAIIDFKPGEIPVGPPEDHRIPQAQVVSELQQAGWHSVGSVEVLPYQFVQVMGRDAD